MKFLRKVFRLCLAQQNVIQNFIVCDSETMKKTIQTALAPLLISGWFCSLGLFEYPFGQPRPYLTCLYFLTTWSSFAYLFYYLLYNSSTSFIYINLSYIVIIIATIVSMLVSLFRYKVRVLKYKSKSLVFLNFLNFLSFI